MTENVNGARSAVRISVEIDVVSSVTVESRGSVTVTRTSIGSVVSYPNSLRSTIIDSNHVPLVSD